ncbi:hypothetical protein C8R42DRAFT_672152 [Lentinula raphanica]|nr:hypothetical protein C8R42DRAFT_672152 [Lentinula raphanica]
MYGPRAIILSFSSYYNLIQKMLLLSPQHFLLLFSLANVVLGQNSSSSASSNSASGSSSASSSASSQLSSFVTTIVTVNSNSQSTTITSSGVATITPSASNSNSSSSNSNSTTTTTPTTFPIASVSTIDGGGGSDAAPDPGQTGSNGKYGPNDGYIAAAGHLVINSLLVTVAGGLVGAGLVAF